MTPPQTCPFGIRRSSGDKSLFRTCKSSEVEDGNRELNRVITDDEAISFALGAERPIFSYRFRLRANRAPMLRTNR
jgi:hypothetical protein